MEKATLKALANQMSQAVRDHVAAELTARLSPLEARLLKLEVANAALLAERDALKSQLDLFQTDERRSDAPLRAVR